MITRQCATVIALFLAFSLGVHAEQASDVATPSSTPSVQSTEIPGSNQRKPEQNQRPAAGEMAILKPTEPPKDQNAGGQGTDSGDRVRAEESAHFSNEAVIANFTIILAAATTLLAVATFGLALSTRGLHRETRRLADEAVKQGEKTERQIAIAERSTIASVTAAQAAVDAIGLERAWMTSGDVKMTEATQVNIDGVDHGQGFVGHMSWVNKGRSPALEVKVQRYFKVIGMDDAFPLFEPEDATDGSGVIGPDRSVNGTNFPIVGADAIDFSERRKQIAFYSKITYKIIGDPDGLRYSEFSGLIQFVAKRTDDKGIRSTLVQTLMAGNLNTAY